jgi:hypothetical protein
VVKQCKRLMENAHDAPRDIRHIFIEVSALKAVRGELNGEIVFLALNV